MPQLDEDDLAALDADLEEFHQVKQIFRTEGVQTSMHGFNNIAKLHIIRHYSHATREMGNPDGFTTETPECLHKDYVKPSYHASNGVVPEPQMLTHLRRQEAWQMLRARYECEGLIERRKRRGRPEEEPIDGEGIDEAWMGEEWVDGESASEEDGSVDESDDGEEWENGVGRQRWSQVREHEAFQFASTIQIAKRPPHVTSTWQYPPAFFPALVTFVRQLDRNLAFHLTENTKLRIWSKFSIRHDPLPFAPLVGHRIDLVRATLARQNSGGHTTRPAVFDTVLIEAYPDMLGLPRYRPGRVKLVFQLPAFYHEACSEHLAFVEWFEPFDPLVEPQHRLPTTRPTLQQGVRATAIVPLRLIRASCHLIPNYDLLDRNLEISAASDLLSVAPEFFLSRHSSYYFFAVMDHWQRIAK
ncbi:hypothetical protein BDV93DRAFT_553533 [Ceratobasidium sp. AG-I]|nr:hypothetical protein BDV93DRAFT_553533 [Ceratobasidium sp. AG-I]